MKGGSKKKESERIQRSDKEKFDFFGFFLFKLRGVPTCIFLCMLEKLHKGPTCIEICMFANMHIFMHLVTGVIY